MKTVIVGCGRVGSVLADAFDRAGHQVIVLDTKTTAFDRLPGAFKGAAVRGDGTDEDTLRRAGADSADLFMAMTEGDNRNVMSAQLATEALGAKQVVAKINDPLRASAYAELGIATLCRTNLMAHAVNDFLSLGLTFGPGLSPATGNHPGGEHHGSTGEPEAVVAVPVGVAPGFGGNPTAEPTSASSPNSPTSPTSGEAATSTSNPAPAAPSSAREG
ncbi:MAG: TrkA family potassium uptake protein [Chloroflexi bacterium]|nr:TrkA family potassium uptake protein [Chloroflexota bacterium]